MLPDDVAYIAFTGKAAQVLASKGCPNATTAHKLLYKSHKNKDGTFSFIPKIELDGDYKLIIVDEVSMLPIDLWQLLLRHRIPVIALGDPFQIPPIDPQRDNHVLDSPHVFLDEIMRQALDSEIIRFSMWIRERKPIAKYPAENKEVMVLDKNELTDGMIAWADQILCAKNTTRTDLNNLARQIDGRGEAPEIGDKIISLTNHWNFSDPPLTNGTIGTITDMRKSQVKLPGYIYDGPPLEILHTTIEDDLGNIYQNIPIDYKCLLTGEKTLTTAQEFMIEKNKRLQAQNIKPPFDFAYANTITVHKFQGSQAPKILVVEENFPFKYEEHARWAYTACTRAEQRLVFIKK